MKYMYLYACMVEYTHIRSEQSRFEPWPGTWWLCSWERHSTLTVLPSTHSSCILLHTLQIHHVSSSFSGSGGSDCGSLALASKSLAYSKLPRPWLSTRIRSFSLSSWDNALTKSCRSRWQQSVDYKVINIVRLFFYVSKLTS